MDPLLHIMCLVVLLGMNMIPGALLSALREFLMPLMESETKRRNLLFETFPSELSLTNKIEYDKDAETFTGYLIRSLLAYGSVEGKHALLHLLEIAGEQRGEEYKVRSKDLIGQFNSWLSKETGETTKPFPIASISDKQKQADLRLLTKLWKYINSKNMLILRDYLEVERLSFAFLERTIYPYLELRRRKEMQSFYEVTLDQAFKKFDDLLNQLGNTLPIIFGPGTFIADVLIPDFKIYAERTGNYNDAIYKEKLQNYDRMMRIAEKVFKQHDVLIETIRSNTDFIFPD